MASAPVLANFIGGKYVPSSSDSTLPVISPATSEVLRNVPMSNASDVDVAVVRGREAFQQWKLLTTKQRAGIMFKFHSLVEQHKDELAALIVEENGKNITEAHAEVAKGNETVEWACSLPQLSPGKILEVSKGIQCMEIRAPLGVVACIVPFNFPLMVPMWTIPIALTLGNCVICKPSEKVPNTMQRISELMVEAGIPAGVFQIVHGGAEVVTTLCNHTGIDAVTFVGSSKVAKIVSNICHAQNKRVLALGGAKNHLIAVPDCDSKMAARDIVASFAGCCGQRCMAASVLILVGGCDDVLSNVVEVASQLQCGQGAGQVGPLIDSIAKERVLRYITEAVERDGADILVDGRSWASRTPGCFVGPTVLLHKNKNDRALLDEIFGPVLSVFRVDTWEEAIEIENANPYGNAACIYTEKGAVAEWFTSRFRAAMLGVNIGIPVPREPFSFGGLYGTDSKFGDVDITGDGAMEFFTNRIKITSKWSSSYGSIRNVTEENRQKKAENDATAITIADTANFDGKL